MYLLNSASHVSAGCTIPCCTIT